MAKETPKTLMGKLWRLLAKLNTAMEPAIRVEATMVITSWFIWAMAKPKVLGKISLAIFFTPS